MRRITYRFVLLIASAAIAPLLLYGVISIRNLQQGTESTVREGNRRLANQVSEEIFQYMRAQHPRACRRWVRSCAAPTWSRGSRRKCSGLSPTISPSSERLRSSAPAAVSSPRAASARPLSRYRPPEPIGTNDVFIAPLDLDEANLPRTTIAIRIDRQSGRRPAGSSVRLRSSRIWKTVDRVRVGTQGYALLVADELRLIAHGDPNKKGLSLVDPGKSEDARTELRRTDSAESPATKREARR